MTTQQPIPLIAFSGGMKSTYLLTQTLKAGPCDVLHVNNLPYTNDDYHEYDRILDVIAKLDKYPHRVRQVLAYDYVASGGIKDDSNRIKREYIKIFALFSAGQKASNAVIHSNIQFGHSSEQWNDLWIKELSELYNVVFNSVNPELNEQKHLFPLKDVSDKSIDNLFAWMTVSEWLMVGRDVSIETLLVNQEMSRLVKVAADLALKSNKVKPRMGWSDYVIESDDPRQKVSDTIWRSG